MKKSENFDLLIGTATAIIILLISILAGKAYDLVDYKSLLIGAVIFTVIILGAVGIVLVFESTKHSEEVDKLLSKIKELIPPPDFDWLYTNTKLAKVEAEATCKDDPSSY